MRYLLLAFILTFSLKDYGQVSENLVPSRMNVLFISIDDLRPDFGAYGQDLVHSPNLDRLAKDGLLFRKAYCQQAICMASRASLMSGIRPENKRIYTCASLTDLVPNVLTLNQHFKENGYKTLCIGKVYHHDEDHIDQFGEDWHDPKENWTGRGYITPEAKDLIRVNKRFDASKKEKGPAYEIANVQDNEYLDGANADFAISKLKKLKKSKKPFFMALGFHKPHLPWCAPKKYWDLYKPEEMTLSPAPEFPSGQTAYSLTNWGELRGYYGIPQGKDQIPDEMAIQLKRAYYACVSYVDAQLGRVLDALEKNGLRENTIVLLWGDHGWKLGDHHAWSKHTNFEVDTRVPLIISTPRMKTDGEQSNAFAELLDMYPTLCDLTGVPKPDHLEGQSLVPILENPENEVHQDVFSIFPRDRRSEDRTVSGFSLRTTGFRYTEWIQLASGRKMAAELYDHRSDSLENYNVAEMEPYKEIVRELAAKLHQKFDQAIKGIAEQPEVFLYDKANLLHAKKSFKRGEFNNSSMVIDLDKRATQLLTTKPYTILDKKLIPPSGDKHDYYSLGIYWWPNPETPDGLPYIRKDGIKNPEYNDYDGVSLHKMADAVHILSLAYFFTEKEEFAAKSTELIHTWFVNPATKMNPHLEYGQAIPGIVEGRGIGIIETGNFLKVINGVGMLKGSKSYSKELDLELKNWFKTYNEWLVSSEKAWDERRWHNNHGSSYDSQVASYSMFVGEDSIARLILDSVAIKRISRQIEPDGSQPWELERTKSMTYSIKNLNHLFENAILGEYYGIDLWNYESSDGRSIKKAVKFLIPYMLGEKKWTYTQLGGIESRMKAFREMIWLAHYYIDDPLIEKAYVQLCIDHQDGLRNALLYPTIEVDTMFRP
ncbi:MAG: alginate lyase family protein [Bacteroidia bacterium]|nr:alginate lyase family protein [Bacteroidia bacterium]